MSGSAAAPVAFFDFDGTLTTGDTLMPFLKYVVGRRLYYANLLMVSPALIGYFTRTLPNDIAKQIVLRQYLKNRSVDKLAIEGRAFAKEIVSGMLRPAGMERLRWHQSQGHQTVLVSASLDVYLSPWCEAQGFSDCITSKLQVTQEGRVTGSLFGANCFGQEKLSLINQWMKEREISLSYAYGDTAGDLFMLKSVNFGYLLRDGRFTRV